MLSKITSTKKILFVLLSFCSTFFSYEKSTDFPHPVDIVYLWVDGGDLNWQAIKDYYLPIEKKRPIVKEDSCSDNRFLDHQELKYSLRSLLAFAPFFNHIYIVTMNQRPKWLIDHPQITIVDHQEIFKNTNDLPTFNSQAIESQIHRIPGLCEHFIYFNDDVLLGKPVTPYDFFTKEGHIKVLFEKGLTVSKNPEVQASLYRQAWLNSNALLDSHFVKARRHRLCHAPFAFRKSLIERAEHQFPFVFSSNASHKFRSTLDFNITNGLLQYICLYNGLVDKGDLSNKMVSLLNDEAFFETKKELKMLQISPPHTFCIQDCMIGESDKTCEALHHFFNTFLPIPAPWEKREELLLEDAI